MYLTIYIQTDICTVVVSISLFLIIKMRTLVVSTALKSKSVRFSSDEEEIKTDLPLVNAVSSVESLTKEPVRLKPVSEHVLTPCASQLEIAKLEAEAILGSPEIADKITPVSFVETLLLRLLDDLNCGRLNQDDIMKLASYSMEIIQSVETDTEKGDVIAEAPEDSEAEGTYLAASSSSIIARKMVDFTLDKILRDIQNGNVPFDDLASLTVSFMDSLVCAESDTSVSVSEAELDTFIDETIKRATSMAMDQRADSPVCDAMLDDFMVHTLKALIRDLEEEVLTKEQVKALAVSVRDEAKHVIPTQSKDEIEKTEDIQNVLHDVLRNLQSGAVDFQTMYQVVSAVAYSYSAIKAPETFDQKEITNLLREVLNVVEEKAGKFEDVNVNIVQEAKFRLSNSDLNSDQVKDLSASVASVIVKPGARNTEMENSMVEEALLIAKDKILNDKSDPDLRQSVMDVAEAVINTLTSRESPFVDVFLDVLRQLKLMVDDIGTIHDLSGQDIQNLIEQISSNEIGEDSVLEMATTVARVVRSPFQSDSSFTASLAVKDCLKVVLNDILDGSIENAFLSDIIEALKCCCAAAGSKMRKTPAFLCSLSEFLRSVLDHLTYRIQTGALDEEDVAELSAMFKNKMMGNEDEMMDQQLQKRFESTDPTQLLHVLQDFVDATEKEGSTTAETKEIGNKLIEFGKRLVGTFGETSSTYTTHSTDNFVEDVVEEVIRNLQIEIESDKLSKETLKEVTKVILDTTSASDIADEAVGHTIRGIHRDIERGYKPSNIQSVPTLADSPSASTVASQVVQQTIDSIARDISQRGIPLEMITSLASSVVTALSGFEHSRDNLPKELSRFRPTITNIIDCLKKDQVSQRYAEEMFCLILEHYKTCVLSHKEQKDVNLSEVDADLVSNLIMETLQNIERCVAKGKMNDKSFSIPSLQDSDVTSFVAERLVDSCLENMRKGFADESKISAHPKHDLVDFILDIVTQLQSELAEGTISNLSMAHFYQAISDGDTDMKTLEMNASTNLTKVVENIKKFRGRSVYVIRILETYLIPDKISDDVFGDTLKAIESILVNVSSEILSKFVKATLQTILMGMREETDYLHERSPSAYVLRSASSIIAENVIKEVVDRINSDMLMKVHKIHGTVSKQDIERAASRLLNESPRDTTKKSSAAILTKKQSMSSVMSKEIEDIVLETLHNIVSNLRLEQSIQSQKGSKSSTEFNFSQEIEDFVLSSLQNIVVDHQDMRSQMDMGVTRSGSKYAASSIELVTGESKEAMAYVNEVLQNVLAEMKAEIVESANETTEKCADADSANIQTLILEYLQRALNDTHGQESLASCMELFSPADVKKVLLESIGSTIQNVKENKFSQADLKTMFDVSRRFLDEADPDCETKQEEPLTPDIVVNLLENVKRNINSIDIQKETLDNISSQLATLGMAVASETSTPGNTRSESSVESSLIGDLIKDVLVRISKQLYDSEHGNLDSTDAGTKNVAQENTNNNDKYVSKSSSKTSGNTNDVNYNRKLSVSTANSCTSNITSVTNKSNEEGENLKFENDESKNQVFIKKEARNKSLTKQERKLTRRSTENRPVIRCSTTPSRTETISKTSAVSRKLKNEPQSEEVRCTNFVSFTEKATSKSKTKASKEITPKRIVKGGVSENNTTTEKKLTPSISSSTFTRKSTGTGKFLAKTKVKNKVYKSADRNETNKGESMPPVAEVPEGPLELKSLCGVHRTKVCYREQQCDISTKSNESDSIKSTLN